MTCKRTQNVFQNLYVDDCEIEDKEKEIKKALKKLNEIDKLKKKSVLNSEEKEKISKELYYRNIINPMPNIHELSEKQKEQEAKKKLKKEKDQQRREAKYEKIAKQAEKEMQEKQKIWEEERKREAERKAKEAERKKEEARREEARREEAIKILDDNDLQEEWNKTLFENNNNIDKTFRLLSLKYHPDKNTNKSWASEKQLELNTLKENSIKKLK
jgi:hypothetical protein